MLQYIAVPWLIICIKIQTEKMQYTMVVFIVQSKQTLITSLLCLKKSLIILLCVVVLLCIFVLGSLLIPFLMRLNRANCLYFCWLCLFSFLPHTVHTTTTLYRRVQYSAAHRQASAEELICMQMSSLPHQVDQHF